MIISCEVSEEYIAFTNALLIGLNTFDFLYYSTISVNTELLTIICMINNDSFKYLMNAWIQIAEDHHYQMVI